MGKTIKEELDIIFEAPTIAITGLVATGGIVAAVMFFFSNARIDVLEAHMAFKDERIATIEAERSELQRDRDALLTQTGGLQVLVDQMLGRIAALEEKVLARALEVVPGGVELNQSDDQPNLTGAIRGALEQSGWAVALATDGPPVAQDWGSAIRPMDPAYLETLKQALDQTGLKYTQVPDEGGSWLVLEKGQLDHTVQALQAPSTIEGPSPGSVNPQPMLPDLGDASPSTEPNALADKDRQTVLRGPQTSPTLEAFPAVPAQQ